MFSRTVAARQVFAALAVLLLAATTVSAAEVPAAAVAPPSPHPLLAPPPASPQPKILDGWQGPPPGVDLRVVSEDAMEWGRVVTTCRDLSRSEGFLLYDGAPLVVVIHMREAGPGGPIGLEAGHRGGPMTKSWVVRGTTYQGLCAAGFREALRHADPSMGSFQGKRPGSTAEALAPLHISLQPAPVARSYTYGDLGAAAGFVTVAGVMAYGADLSLGVGHVAHHFIGGGRLGLFAGTTGFGTTTLLFRASADLGAQLGRFSIVLEPGLGSFARMNGIYGSTNFALGLEGKVGVDLGRWRRNAGAFGLYARGGGFLSVNGAGIYEASLGFEVRP